MSDKDFSTMQTVKQLRGKFCDYDRSHSLISRIVEEDDSDNEDEDDMTDDKEVSVFKRQEL
jgi:hypothetical protein